MIFYSIDQLDEDCLWFYKTIFENLQPLHISFKFYSCYEFN